MAAVNDAPTGSDAALATAADTAYVFSAADFGFRDSDDSPANAWVGVRITTLVSVGTLTLAGAPVAPGQSVSAGDIAAGRLVFSPASNGGASALAVFAFQVQDAGGTANGGVDLDPVARTITLSVEATPVAPADPVVNPPVVTPRAVDPPGVGVVVVQAASPPAPTVRAAASVRPPAPTVAAVLQAAEKAFEFSAVATSFAPDAASPGVVGALGGGSIASMVAAPHDLVETLRLQLLKFGAAPESAAAMATGAQPMPGLTAGLPHRADPEPDKEATRFGLSAAAASSVAGMVVSAGFVTWALRAGGLLSTMLLSMPVWRSVDPLPILAPDADRPNWKSDDEQEREEAAMARLWRGGADYEIEEEVR